METKKLNLEDLNLEDLTQISGGSEVSEYIMYGIGAFCAAWYYAATGPAIRPSKDR